MKKTNTRVRRNGGNKTASSQVPNNPGATAPAQPWWHAGELQCLITGNDRSEDDLWASPVGELYLWNGSLDCEPRAITFDIGLEWWKEFHNPKVGFAAPFFSEDTAAARLVMMVCHNWMERQAELERKLAAPSLEDSINKSVALAVLMQESMCYSETLALGGALEGSFGAGLVSLVHETNTDLLEAFHASKGGVR
jgi:hypothetical protein